MRHRLEWAMVHVAYWIVRYVTGPIVERLPRRNRPVPKHRRHGL